MSALSNVGMWLETTREGPLQAPGNIVNDTAQRTYTLAMLMGNRPDVVARKGKSIIQELKLLQSNNSTEIEPGQERSISNSSSRVKGRWHWRFCEAHRSYNNKQTALNSGENQAFVLENFGQELRNDLKQDQLDYCEGIIWGPALAEMETDTELIKAKPYSIPTFISEQTAPVGLASGGTVSQVNVTTYPNYDNQRYGYDSTNPLGATGILAAFDQMQLLVGFVPPTGKGSEAFSADKRKRMAIFTNRAGIMLFKNACRAGNDRFMLANNNPAYRSVMWDDMELNYVAQLDTALLEQSSGTAYSSAAYGSTKPRYFWVNSDFLYPVFNSDHYMNEVVKDGGVLFPDTEVVFGESMWQTICISRKRQGIICPQASWVTNS